MIVILNVNSEGSCISISSDSDIELDDIIESEK